MQINDMSRRSAQRRFGIAGANLSHDRLGIHTRLPGPQIKEVGMSINIVSLVRASLLGLALMLANTSPASGQAQRTLYERLGGYNGISAVVDDFEDRLFVDPIVGKYFVGMGTDTRETFKQKTALNENLENYAYYAAF